MPASCARRSALAAGPIPDGVVMLFLGTANHAGCSTG
jgi:hypothetical protein